MVVVDSTKAKAKITGAVIESQGKKTTFDDDD